MPLTIRFDDYEMRVLREIRNRYDLAGCGSYLRQHVREVGQLLGIPEILEESDRLQLTIPGIECQLKPSAKGDRGDQLLSMHLTDTQK